MSRHSSAAARREALNWAIDELDRLADLRERKQGNRPVASLGQAFRVEVIRTFRARAAVLREILAELP